MENSIINRICELTETLTSTSKELLELIRNIEVKGIIPMCLSRDDDCNESCVINPKLCQALSKIRSAFNDI